MSGGVPVGPGPVWDVVKGLAASRALGAALELGLFEVLAQSGERSVPAEELAGRLSAADPVAVELLAEVLVTLGLLTTDGQGFGLTEVARRHLVAESAGSMAALAPLSPGPWRGWQELAGTIRRGSPAPETGADLLAMYPALVRATAPTQRAVAAGVVAALAGRGLWPERPRIVDLGCGSGAWLVTMLRDRPEATAVGVDLAGVVDVARESAAAAGVGARLTLLAGDYLTADLPLGGADVVVLAHVLRAEPPGRARRLVHRALDLLAPGGVVVVADYPRPDRARGREPGRDEVLAAARHELVLSLTMAAATAGRGITVADLHEWAGSRGAALTDALEPVPRQSVFLLRPTRSARPLTPEVTMTRTETPQTGERCDTLVLGATVVTMDDERRVFRDGGIAVRGGRIVAVGRAAEISAGWFADDVVDGARFVVTPGLINTHVHITGEPLTRGFVPDDTPFLENVFEWLTPIHAAYTEEDEHISAQLAALEMLKSGTTSFLEAGTIRFIDPVVDALSEMGIRARVGPWAWDQVPEPAVLRQSTAEVIATITSAMDRYGSVADGRVQAWPIVIGHTTCSDELWQAAKKLSLDRGTGMSAHMSPAPMDPEGFLATFGQRPMVHLDEIGVLGSNLCLTHAVHVDDEEIAALARTGTSISHCPTTALKVSYGITQVGRFPEMVAAGVNVAIGTDGNNASNYHDLMRATYLVAGLFKDARRDATVFPAEDAFAMATRNGARALQAEDELGSIEVGKQADLVLHDTHRPEWRPLHNVANQLVWSADGRGVHTVFVGGRRVVEDYRCTTVDEDDLLRRAQAAGEGIVARSGRPDRAKWPTY